MIIKDFRRGWEEGACFFESGTADNPAPKIITA